MMDTVLRSVARMTLLTVKDPVPVRLNSSVTWRPLAVEDESGVLHRWITCDSFGAADVARELHSWWVMGDMAVTRAPMMLHAIEIGQIRNGRRASTWTRAWKHPMNPNLKRLRFRRMDETRPGLGAGFEGWEKVYLADLPPDAIEPWVDGMWREGAAQKALHAVNVDLPSDSILDDTLRQILREALDIRGALERVESEPYTSYAMSRGACDGFVPCPFQAVCYTKTPADVGSMGLYQIRKSRDGGERDGDRHNANEKHIRVEDVLGSDRDARDGGAPFSIPETRIGAPGHRG
jgi:hypothetical protein